VRINKVGSGPRTNVVLRDGTEDRRLTGVTHVGGMNRRGVARDAVTWSVAPDETLRQMRCDISERALIARDRQV
jgi:hypothetical protein